MQESITCCGVIVKWNVKVFKPGTEVSYLFIYFTVHLLGHVPSVELRKEKSLWLAVLYQQGS